MHVLIVGGTGMLGHKLVHVLSADPSLEVHCTVRRLPGAEFRHAAATYHTDVDLSGGTATIAPLIRQLSPDVVINAVGAIKQKDLYADIDATYFVNGTLPHVLSHLNPNSSGRTIHFSTDCVYVGDRGGYVEATPADAVDVYGRSKAIGELTYRPHLTVRTSIIGFETGAQLGLVAWLLKQPVGASIRGFTHAIFSGLPTVTLSRTVLSILHGSVDASGVWHVASEPITKFDLLDRLNVAFGLGLVIEPSAAVSIDRSLSDRRFREASGTIRPSWDTLIGELMSDFASLPYAALYDSLRSGITSV